MKQINPIYEPLVTILLATYNGERYLAEQLDSIVWQTHTNWTILASDDGSNDQTLKILREYAITNVNGPRKGFAANFFSLIKQADSNSDYYAFSDQDDVWDPDKLERAIRWLKTVPNNEPALYCGRTLLVDEYLKPFGYSPLFAKPPGFLNALVQNIGGGNTMVFNRAAFNLLRQTQHSYAIVSHDWWAYLLISGAGGHIFYDPKSCISYRQHQANLVGCNSSWISRYYRMRMVFQGRLKSWIDRNNKHLYAVEQLLIPENKHQLEQFNAARHSRLFSRLIKIRQQGIYRQTYLGQLGLLIAAVFNKL